MFSSSSSSSTYSYVLYNENGFNLTKIITKNSDGTLSSINQLTYNSQTRTVEFEGIESSYFNQLNSNPLICPKGSFHPYDFYNNNYIKPSGFSGTNWELSCWKHERGYFLIFYAHNGEHSLYYVKGNNKNFKRSPSFNDLYAYKLYEYQANSEINHKYDLPSLQKRDNNLILSGYSLTMNSGESTVNGQEPYGRTTITEAKAHTQGSIDSIYYFYYFTYNNVSDFVSGYSNTHIHAGEGNYANSFSATKNTDSPLTFVDNVEIKEINFIPGTKNAYYKIYNKDKGSTYYGLIDVKLNKVVYNIEADNSTIFIPDTTGNMLLITSTDMYRVCTVKSTETDSCENPNTCSNLLNVMHFENFHFLKMHFEKMHFEKIFS